MLKGLRRIALAGQKVPQGYYNLEPMVKSVAR